MARILLQQPGLLFLDEATGALDPEAKIAFHQAIKDNCPDVTVISVMHEAVPPKIAAPAPNSIDSVLHIADGVATKRPRVGLPRKDLPDARRAARGVHGAAPIAGRPSEAQVARATAGLCEPASAGRSLSMAAKRSRKSLCASFAGLQERSKRSGEMPLGRPKNLVASATEKPASTVASK